jgi:uncharacterized protein YlzI (FlbEa/FlbD family)
MNNGPLFIRLHIDGHECMINVLNIDGITTYEDKTRIYVNGSETPFLVDEHYEEIKNKLLKQMWMI